MVATNILPSNNNTEVVTLSSRLTLLKDMASLHMANPRMVSQAMARDLAMVVGTLLSSSTTSRDRQRKVEASAQWGVQPWALVVDWSVECCLRMPFRTMIKTSITKVMVGLFSNLQMPQDADKSVDQGQR